MAFGTFCLLISAYFPFLRSHSRPHLSFLWLGEKWRCENVQVMKLFLFLHTLCIWTAKRQHDIILYSGLDGHFRAIVPLGLENHWCPWSAVTSDVTKTSDVLLYFILDFLHHKLWVSFLSRERCNWSDGEILHMWSRRLFHTITHSLSFQLLQKSSAN